MTLSRIDVLTDSWTDFFTESGKRKSAIDAAVDDDLYRHCRCWCGFIVVEMGHILRDSSTEEEEEEEEDEMCKEPRLPPNDIFFFNTSGIFHRRGHFEANESVDMINDGVIQ